MIAAAAAAAQRVSEAATVADTLSLVSYVFQPTRRLMIALGLLLFFIIYVSLIARSDVSFILATCT